MHRGRRSSNTLVSAYAFCTTSCDSTGAAAVATSRLLRRRSFGSVRHYPAGFVDTSRVRVSVLIFPGEFVGCEGVRTIDGVFLGLFALDCLAMICTKRSQVFLAHSLEEGDRANCSIHIEAVVREDATL
jgi:hypothetical protein